MNEKILVFIGGFIFAVVTARKAYAKNTNSNVLKDSGDGGNYTDEELDALYKRQMREYGLIKTKPEVSAPISFKAESQADCPKGYAFRNNDLRVNPNGGACIDEDRLDKLFRTII